MFLWGKFQRLNVIDYFALLGEARRSWLDEEALKSKFLAFSAEVHPDRVHGLPAAEQQAAHERFGALNAAYHCLREPRERLRHLLELHTGRKLEPVQKVPESLVDLFFRIGQACRSADDFLKRRSAVTSPLLLAELFEPGQEISDQLMTLRGDLVARQEALLAELKILNAEWEQHVARLEAIQQTMSYLQRWQAQMQERIVQLAL